jgi:hypothetical protein
MKVDEAIDKAEKYGKKAVEFIGHELKTHHIYSAAYLVHMLTDKRIKAWHVPAMGYEKSDKKPPSNVAKKLHYVDQTKWLYQHSGMKIPSKDMMTHVFDAEILDKSKGIKHFGQYP